MAPPATPIVPRRAIPGGGPSCSLLGFVVATGGPAGPTSDRAIVERLRQARGAGVTVFDTAGSRDPGRARALLATAFPNPDPELAVVLGGNEDALAPSPNSSHRPRDRGTPSAPEPLPGFTVIREMSASSAGGGPQRAPGPVPPTGGPGPIPATRLDPQRDSLPPSPAPGLYAGPFSLLDRRLRPVLDAASRSRPVGLLARDPFAGGRLDGSRFGEGWLELGPSGGPPPLRSLTDEFEPVLRLGFLTSGRTRTLAQAALQYVTGPPWVVTVLAPLPPADRLQELLGAFSRPPLTEEEVGRIEREPSAPAPPPPRPLLK